MPAVIYLKNSRGQVPQLVVIIWREFEFFEVIFLNGKFFVILYCSRLEIASLPLSICRLPLHKKLHSSNVNLLRYAKKNASWKKKRKKKDSRINEASLLSSEKVSNKPCYKAARQKKGQLEKNLLTQKAPIAFCFETNKKKLGY